MANLKTEYIDIRNMKHKVEHLISAVDKSSKDRIVEELFNALARQSRRTPA